MFFAALPCLFVAHRVELDTRCASYSLCPWAMAKSGVARRLCYGPPDGPDGPIPAA